MATSVTLSTKNSGYVEFNGGTRIPGENLVVTGEFDEVHQKWVLSSFYTYTHSQEEEVLQLLTHEREKFFNEIVETEDLNEYGEIHPEDLQTPQEFQSWYKKIGVC